VIIGNLDLARPLVEQAGGANELVGESLAAALKGADLTRRLLAFARQQPLQPEQVRINEVVAETGKLLSRTLGEDIETSLELAPDIWPAIVDPAQFEVSLANLATNARDAMPTGGRLTIVTANRSLDAGYAAIYPDATPGDYAMVQVGDTGSGMTAAVAARIFEPFYTTKQRGHGSGLGLSMVSGFIKQSGGHINVYSEPGKGTIFRLYLPRAVASAGSARQVVEPASSGAGETVLAVEDNHALRRLVVRQLKELDYRVIEADSAAAALAVLESGTVSVLFTDIVMPGTMNGVELARLVLERWPSVKVILTSGFPEAKVTQEAGPLAASIRLLSKPYMRKDLASALRGALSERPAPSEPERSFP
jgi:CheY-like chemotaxis protein